MGPTRARSSADGSHTFVGYIHAGKNPAWTSRQAPLREAVKEVSSNWPEYFTEKSRVYCAMDGDEVASFCLVDDWGTHFGLRVGAPGCVGTVPRYRRRGIGLRMVQLATGILAREGFDLSWIHYTGVAPWYARLGYETVLRWNARGPV